MTSTITIPLPSCEMTCEDPVALEGRWQPEDPAPQPDAEEEAGSHHLSPNARYSQSSGTCPVSNTGSPPNYDPSHHPHQHASTSTGSSSGEDPPSKSSKRPCEARCTRRGCRCKDRRFSSPKNLRRHVREKGRRPSDAVCPVCSLFFSRRSNRDTHVSRGKCKPHQTTRPATGPEPVQCFTQTNSTPAGEQHGADGNVERNGFYFPPHSLTGLSLSYNSSMPEWHNMSTS